MISVAWKLGLGPQPFSNLQSKRMPLRVKIARETQRSWPIVNFSWPFLSRFLSSVSSSVADSSAIYNWFLNSSRTLDVLENWIYQLVVQTSDKQEIRSQKSHSLWSQLHSAGLCQMGLCRHRGAPQHARWKWGITRFFHVFPTFWHKCYTSFLNENMVM